MIDVDTTPFNIGSFCTGVGMLDESVRLALEYRGVRTRSVFVSEWESYAAACLRSRMEETALESCPIWCGDMRDFPAEDFYGLVDGLVAGFPCQDISCAGKGEGIHGSRSGIWFNILDAAVRMGVSYLFLENVSAITVRGLDAVLRSLAESGFDAEWTLLRASEVGASHRRERWFCVAYRADNRLPSGRGGDGRSEERAQSHERTVSLDRSGEPSPDVAHTGCWEQSQCGNAKQMLTGRNSTKGSTDTVSGSSDTLDDAQCTEPRAGIRQEPSTQLGRDRLAVSSDDMGDTSQPRLPHTKQQELPGTRRGHEGRAIAESGGTPIFAPGPSDPRWPDILRDSPHFSPAVEPGFRVLADGLAGLVVDESRADQLRCGGNGVVALQGAAAFIQLMRTVTA